MQFSKTSQELTSHFIETYSHCMTNQNIHSMNKYLNILYTDINRAETYLETSKFIKKNIKMKINKIESVKQLKFPTLYNSKFLPDSVKQYIELNTIYEILYSFVMNERHITIRFLLQDELTDHKIYDSYLYRMIMWLYMVGSYGSNKCSQTLDIYMYFTDFKKELPESNYSVLNPINANSAFTIACYKVSEIVLYRKEEWFKVFIHETFHNFGLDFSLMRLNQFDEKMKEMFPINNIVEFNAYEAYCDFWARTINAAFTSYFIIDDKTDVERFSLYTDFLIQLERLFSIYQCHKTLNFMGLKYKQLFKKDKASIAARNVLYKENTNVFSYFILTAIIMNKYCDFMDWCFNNNFTLFNFNKTPNNLNHFLSHIKDCYLDPTFLNVLNCVESKTKALKKENHTQQSREKKHLNNILEHSMRMSIIEIE
jgi:hypothetical protein